MSWRADRHNSRRQRAFSNESGGSFGYNRGLRSDKWEMRAKGEAGHNVETACSTRVVVCRALSVNFNSRRAAHLPDDVTFRTKPEMALEQIRRCLDNGIRVVAGVNADRNPRHAGRVIGQGLRQAIACPTGLEVQGVREAVATVNRLERRTTRGSLVRSTRPANKKARPCPSTWRTLRRGRRP